MTTALLYARYSSDLQSDASAEDQLRLCRARALREGWTIAEEFTDLAISGTVRDRPGLSAMVTALEAGRGTIILAESLDRLSRDQEDIAALFKRVRFNGVRIVTLSEGEISPVHIGMNGTMSALFLEQLGAKTRRGQIGRVEAGRIAGGNSFGYRMVRDIADDGSFERGRRAVREDQAQIIRRIFADYIAGIGPKAIAIALNSDGIASPRGGLWRANSIIGHKARANGILNNELYRGKIVFNRQRFLKDPDTRKRVSRLNPETEWIIKDAPELRIVDEETWSATQARLATGTRGAPWTAKRPKRLFSGLINCGECGGAMTIIANERFGCPTAYQTGTCTMTATIGAKALEDRVITAMDDQWLHPDTVAAYVDEFMRTATDLRRARMREGAGADRRIGEIDADLDRIADAIMAGVAVSRLKSKAEALENERAAIIDRKATMAEDAAALDDLIYLPNLAAQWRDRVSNLREALDGPDRNRAEARSQIRAMVETIICTRKSTGRGLDITLQGKLAAILETTKGRTPKGNGLFVSSKLVAGACISLERMIVRAAA